jgi:hypothetical protein
MQHAEFVSKEARFSLHRAVCKPVSCKFTSHDRRVIMSSLKLLLGIIGGSGGVNVEWGCNMVGLLCERLPNDHIESV